MPKVVINSSSGGFNLSHDALMFYGILKKFNMKVYCKSGDVYKIYKKKVGSDIHEYLLFHCILPDDEVFPEVVNESFIKSYYFQISDYSFLVQIDGKKRLNDFRSDPYLVQVVESLDELAYGEHSRLKIVDVPDDVVWDIWAFEAGNEIVKEVSREWG